jgi:hypothetical protein
MHPTANCQISDCLNSGVHLSPCQPPSPDFHCNSLIPGAEFTEIFGWHFPRPAILERDKRPAVVAAGPSLVCAEIKPPDRKSVGINGGEVNSFFSRMTVNALVIY